MTAAPTITAVQLGGGPDLPLLVLGPSLGTSASALWSGVADRLGDSFHVVGWDLPGHGHSHGHSRGHGRNAQVADGLTVPGLAAGVLAQVDRILDERGEPGGSFAFAGDSIGGAVGLQLLLDAPGRVSAAAVLCSAARFGDSASWHQRADLVRASGTPVMVEGSAQRWFSPGFLEREPATATALLHVLQDADRHAYAAVCEALAVFDVRDRLSEITAPVLAIAGADDVAAPVAGMELIARGVQNGRLVVLDGVAHLAPAEAPDDVARLLRDHLSGGLSDAVPDPVDGLDAGMAVRREVLGDAHVDRASAAATDFTRDFQEFITRYAWGGIWTRPGLDRRSRSLITLTALVARGHHEELAMHVRAARTNGVTNDEIKELLLQTAIYCGVPDANTAFRIAQRVLDEIDSEEGTR